MGPWPFSHPQMSIDDWLGHMDTDEVMEVTPGDCRLAKKAMMKASPKHRGGGVKRGHVSEGRDVVGDVVS